MTLFHEAVAPQNLDDISRASLLAWLGHLDKIDNPRPIVSEAQYLVAAKVKRMLAALYCLTFNEQRGEFDRVASMEGKYGKVMYQFNRGLLIKDRRAALVARYMLWNYRLTQIDADTPFLVARAYNLLRKRSNPDGRAPTIVVVGLERKVGDNLFTTGSNGRPYRMYTNTVGRQAFECCRATPFKAEDQAAFEASLPELCHTYCVTSIGDGKFMAKPSAFGRSAIRDVLAVFNAPWAQSLVVSRLPSLDAPEADELPVRSDLDTEYTPEASGVPIS